MAKYKKAIGALLGGVTAGLIIAVAGMFGADVDPGLAAAIAVLCGTLGTTLAPRNAAS